MTEPNPQYANGSTPVAVLAGRAWPMPKLVVKQHRIVDPALYAILPWWWDAMESVEKEHPLPPDAPDGAAAEEKAAAAAARAPGLAVRARLMATKMATLTTAQYDLFLTAVYGCLQRAHPAMTRDEFDNMEITANELLDAFPVMLRTAGIFKDAKPGEAQAQPANPTGSA